MTRRFSLRVIVIGVSLLAAVVLAGCKDKGRIVEPKEGPAHLVIPQQEWYLGNVPIDAGIIQRDVLMINDGSEPLVVDTVEALCHCIRAEYPDHPIRPGHGGRLRVFLNVNELTAGEFCRSVIVNSNGGAVTVDFTGTRMN